MANPSLVVKIGADIAALKAALEMGQTELIKTAAGAKALAGSMSGARLEQSALQMAVAVKSLGGATTLTASEAKKADAAFQAWFEKAAKTGKAIDPELQKIAADTRKIVEETKKAEEETKKLADAEKKLAEEAKKAGEASKGFFAELVGGVAIGNLVADALKKVGSMAVDAFTSAAMAVPNMIQKTMDLGGQLFDLSLKTGASVENLSRLRYVSSQTGIGMDTFVNSMAKMQMNLGQVGAKSEEVRARLSTLGLSLTTLKNSRPDEAFISVMTALEKIPNRADQAAAGMAIFGKGFKDMAGLSQESLTELLKAADDLGLTLTTEMAAAADLAGDAIARIKMQWESFTLRIGAAFLPAVIGLAENFSTVLAEALSGTSSALEDLGKGDGFIATVSKAMGTGNEAIAAQAHLYEILRDALIDFVRSAIQPTLSALSYLMVLFNAAKVVFGDVAQVIDGLVVTYRYLELAMVKVASMTPGAMLNKKLYDDWANDVNRALDSTMDRMMKRAEGLKQAKANEDWWADGAKKANEAISASLDKLAKTQIDVAKMIADNASVARAAAGAASNGLAETTDLAIDAAKKLATVTEEAMRLGVKFATMQAQGATGKELFEAMGSGAKALEGKFAELGAAVPAEVQKIIDAVNALGMEIKIAEWMEKQRADVRKILEDMAKDTEALAAKQRESMNKGFTANLDIQIKAAKDLEALEADSLDKRLRAIHTDMEARRAAVEKNRDTTAGALRTIDQLEEATAAAATVAWQEHIQEVASALPTLGNAFKSFFNEIPSLIEKALTGTGKIGDAITASFSNLGSKLMSGLMSSQAIGGKMVDFVGSAFGGKAASWLASAIPGIGAAIGTVLGPVMDKVWGALTKAEGKKVNDLRDQYVAAAGGFDKLVEQARKAGVELSSSSAFQRASTVEAWNKAVADLDAKLKKSAEDRKKMLAEVMAGERLATKAFISEMQEAAKAGGDAAKEATDYFTATLKTASSGLTQMFAGLEKGATAAAQAAAVKLHMAAGMTEADAKKAAEGITGIFVKTQAQATGLAGAIAGTFGKMIENGASFREALAAIKGPLDTMRKQLELTGLSGGDAFNNLSRMGQIADGQITGPLMDAIDGANQALIGLSNSGLMNQDTFAALATTATDAYQQIIAQGVDGQAAMQMMQPTLQTMWEMQQQFGYEVDAATQALIDEAVAAGQVGEAHMSAQERTAQSMKKVADIMEAIARKMGVDLPAAAEAGARGINDAFSKVDPSVPPPWDGWGPPPDIEIDYSYNQTGEPPQTEFASGGVVYAAGGWMQPKGSDIVPAMLTPGERVLTVGQNYDYENRMRTGSGGSGEAPVNVNITIQALDPIGLKKVVEEEVGPMLVSAYRRNAKGLRTDTRKELVE